MTVSPVSRDAATPAGHGRPHGRLARWAVALSAAFGVAIATSATILVVALGVGGQGAIEDNWVGALVAITALAALLAALAAFVPAVVATIRGERWTLLWAPLCAFPAFVAFLVLGEAFWWE